MVLGVIGVVGSGLEDGVKVDDRDAQILQVVQPLEDTAKVAPIAVNAKVQRPSVCNALDTLLIHQSVAGTILPDVAKAWAEHGVEIRCEPKAYSILKEKGEFGFNLEEFVHQHFQYLAAGQSNFRSDTPTAPNTQRRSSPKIIRPPTAL